MVHLQEKGWCAVDFQFVYNCWARNIGTVNAGGYERRARRSPVGTRMAACLAGVQNALQRIELISSCTCPAWRVALEVPSCAPALAPHHHTPPRNACLVCPLSADNTVVMTGSFAITVTDVLVERTASRQNSIPNAFDEPANYDGHWGVSRAVVAPAGAPGAGLNSGLLRWLGIGCRSCYQAWPGTDIAHSPPERASTAPVGWPSASRPTLPLQLHHARTFDILAERFNMSHVKLAHDVRDRAALWCKHGSQGSAAA